MNPTAVIHRRSFNVTWIVLLAAAGFVFTSPAQGQGLGRLFSTPEERVLLDELRANRDLVVPEPEPVTQTAVPEPTVERLSVDGLVIRSSGANSVWVNGRPVFDGWTTREGVRVDTTSIGRSGRVKITLPSGADIIDLKPGQKIDVTSGVVVESYQPATATEGDNAFDQSRPAESLPTVEPEATARGAAPVATSPDGEEVTPESFLDQLRKALGGGQ